MKNKIIISLNLIVFLSCASNDKSKSLQLEIAKSLTPDDYNGIIKIKLNKFLDTKPSISIQLMKNESFIANNFNYKTEYTFDGIIDNSEINLKIPTGHYVGNLTIYNHERIPYYISKSSSTTVRFGINGKREKYFTDEDSCSSRVDLYDDLVFWYSRYNCKPINISQIAFNIEFSLAGEDILMKAPTAFPWALSIMAAFSPALINYPYIGFLFYQGISGSAKYYEPIHLDKLEK